MKTGGQKGLDKLMDYGNAHNDKGGDVYAFWEAIGDFGEWDSKQVVNVIWPILARLISSLLSEQEAEFKEQKREAIKDSVEKALLLKKGGAGIMMLGLIPSLFKKHNCEEEKDAE